MMLLPDALQAISTIPDLNTLLKITFSLAKDHCEFMAGGRESLLLT